MADNNDTARTVQVRASEDGVEVETGDTGDIVLIPWSEAVKVSRQIIYLARERGDLS
jgi:hypothetical protein